MSRWLAIACLVGSVTIQFPQADASSAADQLLKTVEKKPTNAEGTPTAEADLRMLGFNEVKLNNPFAMQLFSAWQTSERMPYHVNVWVQKVLKEDFKGAAHLWSQVQKDFSAGFAPVGNLTQTYLYWRLNLASTFLDSFLDQLILPTVRESKAMDALVQTIQPGFSRWLVEKSVVLTPQQSELILGELRQVNTNPVFDYLRAWALLRSKMATEEFAIQTLERIPVNDPLKISLAKSVALGFAKRGDLGKTGQILKMHLEPSIQAKGDPRELASYYLQIARLLYQAEALDAAETFYKKIPNSLPEFLTAREELSWVLLRKGEISKLRGELKNFKLGLFDEHFLPEALVVSAISNLKQCYYGKVEDDFQNFLRIHRGWAQRIEKELQANRPSPPGTEDLFVRIVELNKKERERELMDIQNLAKDSINAVLPAVGVQAHWQDAQTRQRIALENAEKLVNREYHRVWKNRGSALREAIRKMKFVKVELLSQVSQIAAKSGKQDSPDWDKLKKVALQDEKDSIMFPFDGVVWSDELFRLRSVSESVCL